MLVAKQNNACTMKWPSVMEKNKKKVWDGLSPRKIWPLLLDSVCLVKYGKFIGLDQGLDTSIVYET